MNLPSKVTKTQLLLLGMTLCFFAALLLICLRADRTTGSADYTITTDHRDTGSIEVPETAPLNVNTATAEELEALPGIGAVTAQRIIEHREQYGPFLCMDDLLNVYGIGPSTLEQLEGLVIFSLP